MWQQWYLSGWMAITYLLVLPHQSFETSVLGVKISSFIVSSVLAMDGIWALAWYFQQCGILTCVDSDEPLQPLFKLRNTKCCFDSSLTVIGYISDWQRHWSDCAYAQADLRRCWLHISHCWKSHEQAHMFGVRIFVSSNEYTVCVVGCSYCFICGFLFYLLS